MHRSKKQKGQLKQNNQEVSIAQSEFSGPVPRPEDLKIYNEMIPNGAERFMIMAEKEQEYRHKVNQEIIEDEKKVLKREFISRILGQIFGFLALLFLIGLCWFAFEKGNPAEAQKIATWSIVSVVGLFITGKFLLNKR